MQCTMESTNYKLLLKQQPKPVHPPLVQKLLHNLTLAILLPAYLSHLAGSWDVAKISRFSVPCCLSSSHGYHNISHISLLKVHTLQLAKAYIITNLTESVNYA